MARRLTLPTKRQRRPNVSKELNDLQTLNTGYNRLVKNISTNIQTFDPDAEDELAQIDSEIDNVINSILTDTKSITSDDMEVFLVKLFNDQDRNILGPTTMDDIFSDDSSNLFQFFQDRYQNKNMLYEDLDTISSQLFELSEAVLTTRDSIVTSENISERISRNLQFMYSKEGDDSESYIKGIVKLEDELKLPAKLKNLIIPNTLTYGEYYVYVCPYAKLFEQQYRKKVKDPSFGTNLKESVLTEGMVTEFKNDLDSRLPRNQSLPKDLNETLGNYLKDIEVYNDCFSIPLVEGVDLTDLMDAKKFGNLKKPYVKDQVVGNVSSDGLIDTAEDKKIENMFKDIQGCYIKYIDPKHMIPVQILDTVIGYYYIHDVNFEVDKAPFSSTIRVTNNAAQNNADDVETMFMSRITDIIVKSFDKSFLETNAKFKDMILAALQYNDLYKRQIKFQFIPKDYVVPFKVNEDTEGNGHSVLFKSLFYAKLYLSLLVFKMISIITRSNDTKVYWVKNSGLENNITNKIQEVARAIKGRQINFMDLLNYNSIISKIGAYKEMFIPTGRSGEHGIDFDVLAGQDVPLNTDLMEMLRTNMINGTGVPSVIMNYINEADYAKTLTMANSKFIGRVISLQLDLNDPITDLYKKIIKFSNISIPEEMIDSFKYTLNPPRSLNTTNMAEMISNADVVSQNAVRVYMGENQNDDKAIGLKDELYNRLMKEYLPMIDWGRIDELYKESHIAQEKKEAEKPVSSEGGDM